MFTEAHIILGFSGRGYFTDVYRAALNEDEPVIVKSLRLSEISQQYHHHCFKVNSSESSVLAYICFKLCPFEYTVKPVLSGHSKIDKTKVLKTNGSLMKVESIAECSKVSILQYF